MSHSERHLRLFRNGRNQAVRIPREFELEGDEEIMRKEGGRLIVEPIRKGRLLSLLATLSPLAAWYVDVLIMPIQIRAGDLKLNKPLVLWVNDGLMAVFFLL